MELLSRGLIAILSAFQRASPPVPYIANKSHRISESIAGNYSSIALFKNCSFAFKIAFSKNYLKIKDLMSLRSLAHLQRRQLGLRSSPFSIFRFFKVQQNQPQPIKPVQIPAAANISLVHNTRNPKKCTCGWYHFYGKCGHMYQRYAGTCGRTTTSSGRSGFCTTPAPKNVVYGYYVNEKCTNAKCTVCRRRGH